MPQLKAMMDSYGAMKSVIFKRIGVGGLDICEVELEHEETEWRIIRGPDGKTLGIGFRPLCYDALERIEIVQREEVLAKLRERIVAFAASHLSRDVAEDLAQEVLILLHEKYAHLEKAEDLLPLSLQIVRFKIMSLRRKSVRRGEYTQVSITDIPLPDLDANPADQAERKQMMEHLSRAMGQLGERCRNLMRLKLQGKSFPEIQKIMGVAAINTIYTWDHRCRKNLMELMGGDWEPKR